MMGRVSLDVSRDRQDIGTAKLIAGENPLLRMK